MIRDNRLFTSSELGIVFTGQSSCVIRDNVVIYKCSTCSRTFQVVRTGVACAVLHPPGFCCHYNDEEIEDQP